MEDAGTRPQTFHQSDAILIIQIVLLQLMFALASAVLILTLFYLFSPATNTTVLAALIIFVGIILYTINAVTLVFLVKRHEDITYSISPDRIIVHRRGPKEKTKIYNTRDLEETEVDQTKIGRNLDYGTLSFKAPGLDSRVELPNIPHPWQYASLITQSSGSPQ
jgi:predicted membrane protein